MKDQEESLYFNFFAFLNRIPEQLFYNACPKEGCKKKVNMENGRYFCVRCQESFDEFEPVFLANLMFSDETGQIYVTLLGNKYVEALFQMKAEELYKMSSDKQKMFELIRKCAYAQFRLKVRAKLNFYQDKRSVRFGLANVKNVQ